MGEEISNHIQNRLTYFIAHTVIAALEQMQLVVGEGFVKTLSSNVVDDGIILQGNSSGILILRFSFISDK